MSALFARLGLAESRVVSLSVLGRGNRQYVYGVWWGGRSEQSRKASWWKKSYDGGMGSDEFGLGGSSEQANEEREAHRKTSEFVRDKGWGLRNTEQEDTGTRWENNSRTVETEDGDPDKLNWSQSSEDAYWITASQPVDEDQRAPSRLDSDNPAWNVASDELQGEERSLSLSTRAGAPDKPGLGWSQQSEDAFWDHTSRSPDDVNENEQAPVARYVVPKVVDDSPSQSSQRIPEEQPWPDIDYEALLPIAMEQNDQDMVARCLYAARDHVDFKFISGISETIFTDILHVLEPRRNILELSNVYMETSEHMAKQIGVMNVDKFMLQHAHMLHQVAMMRGRSGRQLTNAQYLILLRSAVDLGSSALARWLWRDLQVEGVLPDLDMYNAYLSSFVWAGHNNSTARHRERVINFNMTQRKKKRRDMPFANYHIGTPGGIREKSMQVLEAMLKDGISASEDTYCSLITAAAREGELDTINSILHTVWDIDVTKVSMLAPGDAAVPKPKALPKDSQQYPTSKLLWTLAHAFGINNKIPIALRLVDYVSREYDVAIGDDIWSVLFEWTFVLASPRSGTNARDDRRIGQLPKVAVEQLFKTMTQAPYSVKPTMGMYNRLITSLAKRGISVGVLSRMAQGAALNEAPLIARKEAWQLLEQYLDDRDHGEDHAPVAVARRQWEDAAVVCARNHLWMKRWVRLFLKSLTERNRDRMRLSQVRTQDFNLNKVSRLLWDWRHCAGAYVKYDLPTGILEIQLQSEQDMLRGALWRERKLRDREAAMDRAKLLVGDELLVAPVDALTDTERSVPEVTGTTKRLRKARRAAEASGDELAPEVAPERVLFRPLSVQERVLYPPLSVQVRRVLSREVREVDRREDAHLHR